MSVITVLKALQQTSLLKYLDHCPEIKKNKLLTQISSFDLDTLNSQRKAIASLNNPENLTPATFTSFLDYSSSGNQRDREWGKQYIAEGKLGCLVVAGGQGTRLHFKGPKGLFPVSPIMHKSLFQLLAEKVLAAGKQVNRLLSIAIMTSPLNHEEVCAYFETNHFFGLAPEQIDFFPQGMLPFLDPEGNLFLEAADRIAMGPDGNGSSLYQFVKQGLWKKWRDKGIESLHFVMVDNPLSDPFDAELVGFHRRTKAEITVKCTTRRHLNEKVGLLVKNEGHVQVIEYSEMPDSEKTALDQKGHFKHVCANLSLFCFDMDFIGRICGGSGRQEIPIPLHLAFKTAPFFSFEGKVETPSQPNAWKFERFIFDLLPFSQNVRALLYPREICFAPLKNFSGEDSLTTVQQALQHSDAMQFQKITGVASPQVAFELSQEFYYPTDALMKSWKGRRIEGGGYIDAGVNED